MSVLIPVLLAGGEGRRLLPGAPPALTKPFLKLAHPHRSLLQQAAERALRFAPADEILTVTSDAYIGECRSHLSMMDEALTRHLLSEPAIRDTAAAAALAAHYALARWEDPVLILMPTDHAVEGLEEFDRTLRIAEEMARSGQIVAIGIPPSSADSGYGYISCGEWAHPGVFHAVSFVEKPEPEHAAALLAKGNCYWNSGIFVLRAAVLLEELALCHPALYEALEDAFATASFHSHALRLDLERYRRIPAAPIDRAVMERTGRLVMVPAFFAWADLGTWGRLLHSASHGGPGLRDAMVEHDENQEKTVA